jgi:hypothetical protein
MILLIIRNIQASLDIFKSFWANWVKQAVLIPRIIQVHGSWVCEACHSRDSPPQPTSYINATHLEIWPPFSPCTIIPCIHRRSGRRPRPLYPSLRSYNT